MYPILHSRLATPVALTSLAIWCAFALLVFTIGASPKVTTTTAPVNNARGDLIAFATADVDEPQVSATAIKSDRLPLPLPSSPLPSPPVAEAATAKPAEAIDYSQTEAEQVRSAHAEALDLCQRHGMHKKYFSVGRRQSWRCER
jgi:hypothetical protein